MLRFTETIALVLTVLLAAAVARAQPPEDKRAATLPGVSGWLERFHLSGNTDLVYFNGEQNSLAPGGRYVVDNARLFLDIDLGRDLQIGTRPIVGDASVYIEWDMFHEASFQNALGALYLRLDRPFGVEAINLKLGRMTIPYGEEYVRFHEQRPDNPLISFSAPAPYGWDEGLLLFGANAGRSVQYFLGVMDGDEALNAKLGRQLQVNGKLIFEPTDWLHLSVSGLRLQELGRPGREAESALEFGETHVTAFGSETDVPSFQRGTEIADDPNLEVDSMTAAEADLILSDDRRGRLWLAYGHVAIRSDGSSTYDRDLAYWIAEGILPLGQVSSALEKLYVAARYSAFGTFDSDEGYLLDATNEGEELGFNTESVSVVSVGVGLKLNPHLTVKSEYSWYDFDVVRGVTEEIRADAGRHDYFGIGLTVKL